MRWMGPFGGRSEYTVDQRETVVSTASISEPQGVSVYNFTVADDHTYFVEGASNHDTTGTAAAAPLDALWVHDDCAAAENATPFQQIMANLQGVDFSTAPNTAVAEPATWNRISTTLTRIKHGHEYEKKSLDKPEDISAYDCVPCGLIGFSLFLPAVGAYPLRWQPVE